MSKKIKERHLEAIAGCCINDASANHAAERSEAITELVSCSFIQWYTEQGYYLAPFSGWSWNKMLSSDKSISTKELFEIFKKETGL